MRTEDLYIDLELKDERILKLKEALESMVDMVEMNGFGKAYAMELAKEALKEQGE